MPSKRREEVQCGSSYVPVLNVFESFGACIRSIQCSTQLKKLYLAISNSLFIMIIIFIDVNDIVDTLEHKSSTSHAEKRSAHSVITGIISEKLYSTPGKFVYFMY